MVRLLFRCWHKIHEKMYNVFELHDGVPTIAQPVGGGDRVLFYPHDMSNLTVLQASPYDDRNGKPIFEGDNVTCSSGTRPFQNGSVFFDIGCFMVRYIEQNDEGETVEMLYDMAGQGLEVTGNVFTSK